MYRNKAGFQDVVELWDVVLQLALSKFLLVNGPRLCMIRLCSSLHDTYMLASSQITWGEANH